VTGVASAAVAFFTDPVLRVEMGPELAPVARGFYPPERAGDVVFAWTSSRADLSLRGFDRASEWTCSLRFRGARAAARQQPLVQVAADGVVLARQTGTNEYQDLAVTIPTKAKSGLLLTIATAPTFVPGPADSRELGVQVQSLTCRPGDRFALPPRGLLTAAGLSAALVGAAFGALGLAGWYAAAGTLVVAGLQAIPLSSGFAPYSPYLTAVPWVAFWIAVVSVAGAALVTRWRGQPLHEMARLAIALSAGALLLELLALLHPSKAVVDAVFHAHRLQWVLEGRYYFTQPMPDGVRFPYAIALYVVAAPWTLLTRDYVALLKVVVSVSRTFAGLLLYPMTARAWNDRVPAVIAVGLFHLVPLPFIVIGNANMTYAFGQSIAGATLAALATYSFGRRAWLQTAGLFVAASVAFLSHVGIFPLLLAIMLVVAAFYRLCGGAELRPAANRIALAGALAALFSVVVYYGHFPESYSTLQRVRGQSHAVTAPSSVATPPGDPAAGSPPPSNSASVPAKPRHERLVRAAQLGVTSFGWPLALLAAVGTIALWAAGTRDRVTLLAAACGLVYVGFVGFSATAPIEPRFQRYSEEFISRVNFAVMPVAVVLAARGTVWAWRFNLAARAATVGALAAALIVAARVWLIWVR
jgi:hypothetical protein